METKEMRGLMEAYASIYTHLSESHYKVGDEVTCKKSGMTGKVVKVDPEERGKYYTVEREDGKEMKYSPEELKKGSGGVSKKKEEKFHSKLDKLVHKTFGKSPEEQKEEVEYFTEEVEIAAQYFYNLGLNEDGVAIVIEELGPEEFSEWVYDLAEEYVLTEAEKTRLQDRGNLKGPKGSKPQSTTSKRVKTQGGVQMRTSARPESTVKPGKRTDAAEKAKDEQPKKRPVLDAIARRVMSGMERHKKATGELKKMGAATRETAGKLGKAAREFARGFRGEEYDSLISYLLDEGYAETEEAASSIVENMSEGWIESIMEAHAVDRQRLAIQQGRSVPTIYNLKNKPKRKSVGD